MDRVGADFNAVVEGIRERLGAKPLPLHLPIGIEDSFTGMVDLVAFKAVIYQDDLGVDYKVVSVPAELQEDAMMARELLIETIADVDEEVMELYLEGREIPVEMLKRAIRKGTIEMKVVPVLCGSAFKNKGIQLVLDAVVDYLPSPLDLPPIRGINPDTNEEEERIPSEEEPFTALAFKIMVDPFVGRLVFCRIYSGRIEAGQSVLNATTGKRERIGRILRMHANKREELETAEAGAIIALPGLKGTRTGETLCEEGRPIVLESLEFPEPVIDLAVEPLSKADQVKLSKGLSALAEEDPTFRVHVDEETGQTIIQGMGELHLEILVDRLKREFGVEVRVGRPQVAYRESIRNAARAQGKFVRQSGGHGQYGDIVIEMEPLPDHVGFEIEDRIVGGVVPKEFIPAVRKGLEEARNNGILGGYPVIGVKIALVDGSYHEVDSSELAFKIAASMAFKEAMKKASPVLMEPVMEVEVVTPEDYVGDVMGDLASRRGSVEGMEMRSNARIVRALVPLAEMFGYATDLRSKTSGRASYSMKFQKYAEVGPEVAEKVLKH
jgi:elongation factor G